MLAGLPCISRHARAPALRAFGNGCGAEGNNPVKKKGKRVPLTSTVSSVVIIYIHTPIVQCKIFIRLISYYLIMPWNAYRQNAMKVVGEIKFGTDDDEAAIPAILSWHYQVFLSLEEEKKEDRKKKSCQYCGNRNGKCCCYQGLHACWFAARLCALVMPTSAAAERVFSLLNNLYSDQQTSTLVDSILLSLFLSYNNRKVIVHKKLSKN